MSELDSSTVYLLKRAELAVRGCVEMALASMALTPAQFFVLLLVSKGEATSSAELARAMGMLPQSMTEILAPLEKRGVLERRPDPRNGRILRAQLTPEGERLFAATTKVAERLERELLSGFAARDVELLNTRLTELTTAAETHSYHPKLRRLGKVTKETRGAMPRARTKRRATRAR